MRRVAVLICLSLLTVCGPAGALGPHDGNAAIRNAVEGFIRPGYRAFSASTGALRQGVDALCADPSKTSLDWARARFRELVRTWSEIEIIRFGPVTQENRLERILFWPDRKGVAIRQIMGALASGGRALRETGPIAGKSVALQGFGALEYLLFGTESETLGGSAAQERCGFARAVTINLDEMATALSVAWDDPEGISRAWIDPGEASRIYRSDEEALTELLDVFVHGLELVRDVRIGGFLDEEATKDRPKQAIFWRSGETVATIAGNLRGLRSLYFISGMGGLLPDDQRWISDQIGFEFDNAGAALVEAGGPIADTLADEARRGKLAYVGIVVTSLFEAFSQRVSGALGLTAGFSSLDGD